jgi:glycosyltransferase involved in cell wall biosynthesis
LKSEIGFQGTVLMSAPVSPKLGGRDVGGIANHVAELSLNLAEKGYRVVLIGYSDRRNMEKANIKVYKSAYSKITKFLLGFSNYLRKRRLLNSIVALPARSRISLGFRLFLYQKISKQEKIDVIHVHSLGNQDVFLKAVFKEKLFVLTDHGFTNRLSSAKTRESHLKVFQKAVDLADFIIAISDYSEHNLREYGFDAKGKVIRINNPLSLKDLPMTAQRNELKETLKVPKDKTIVFFNGYHESVVRKGLDILIDAFAHDDYLQKECFLIAITDDEGKKLTDGRFQELRNSWIMGYTDWNLLTKLYNVSDVFVMPSRSEGFGLVYIEALAVGCPIIGFEPTFQQFEREIDRFIGYPFNPQKENAAQLGQKIRRLIGQKPLIAKPEEIRERVAQIYDWKGQIPKFIAIYHKAGQA